MGLLKKLFGSRPEAAVPDPDPEPQPENKKIHTSWIDELSDPSSPVHEKLKSLVEASKNESVPAVSVSVELKKVERGAIGLLSHLDFGKPEGSLGCFLNYEPRQIFAPTERQLLYLRDLGVFIPEGVTNKDATCMISRATGDDSLEGPTPEIVDLAEGLGVKFSAFVGASGLLGEIIAQVSDRDRASLYVYGVLQSINGRAFGNMLKDPARDRCFAFADIVEADPALRRSLDGRPSGDFLEPHKGTSIYKAAVSYLVGGGSA